MCLSSYFTYLSEEQHAGQGAKQGDCFMFSDADQPQGSGGHLEPVRLRCDGTGCDGMRRDATGCDGTGRDGVRWNGTGPARW